MAPLQNIAARRLADLQAQARAVAVSPERVAAARGRLGARASAALGDDIPRPRPVAETRPAPLGNVGFEPDLSAASDAAIPPEQWVPLARKEVARRQGGGEPLTLEETRTLAIALEQQGVDPFFLFSETDVFPEDFRPAVEGALANDPRTLTPQQVADVMRKIERGEPVPPEVAAALRRSGTEAAATELPPVPTAAPTEPAGPAPQSFVKVGGGKTPRYVAVGADGQEIGDARRVGSQNLYEFGGRRYSLDDTGEGVVPVDSPVAAGPESLDNVEQSGFDLSMGPNTTPNKKRTNKIDFLADRIRQATTETDTESLSGKDMRRMQAEVAALTADERQALLQHPSLAEGIESIQARRDPAARDAAIANAQRRLDALAEQSGISTSDRAAEQVATASDAREVARTPRRPSPDRAAAAEDLSVASQLVGETLPEGDWNGLLAAYHNIEDADRKAEIARRLPAGTALKATTAVSDLDGALMELDAALQSGNAARIEEARLDVQTYPASPEEMAAARKTFFARQQAASALRNAIIGTDPLYTAEQARALAANAAPAPRPAITPGARSIEVATEDVPAAEMPGMFENARAAERERQAQLAQRSPGGGTPIAARMDAAGVKKAKDLPLGLRSAEDPNRQPPLERRSPSEWPIDTDDKDAIADAEKLQSSIAQASEELRLAQVRRDDAGVKSAQDSLRTLLNQEDKLFPPRLVNQRTGIVLKARPEFLSGGAKPPKGWVLERGRPARSDSRLNRGGSQETFDNALVSIIGGRPKVTSTIPRSNADLSPADRARIRDSVSVQYGDDALEYLPDEPLDDLPELGEDGKRARTGSSRQESRVVGGLRVLFGDDNPLSWAKTDGEPLYANADEVAADLLSRNTVGWRPTHTLEDGTQQPSAGYEVAKRSIADAIERQYGMTAARRRPDAAGEEAVTSRPPEPEPAAPPKPKRTRKPSAKAAAGEAPPAGGLEDSTTLGDETATSAVESKPLGDTAGDGGLVDSEPLDAATLKEIEDEADAIEAETLRQYLDAGEGRDAAKQYAKEARTKHVTEQRAARKKTKPAQQPASAPAADAAATGVADSAPIDNVQNNLDASATNLDPADSGDLPAGSPGSTAQVIDYTDASRAADPDSVGMGTAQVIDNRTAASHPGKAADGAAPPAAKKSGWGKWLLGAGGMAVVGGGLAGLSRLNAPGPIDLPMPPGGGGGGGGPGGGDFFPIPGDVGGGAEDEAAAQEEAINRALDRIRGSRNPGGQPPMYQTYQTYNVWR
jgi:hypothetical protein